MSQHHKIQEAWYQTSSTNPLSTSDKTIDKNTRKKCLEYLKVSKGENSKLQV